MNWQLSGENENSFIFTCDAVYFNKKILPFRMNVLPPCWGYKGMGRVDASERFVNL